MIAQNPKVDWYFEKDGPWKEAFAKLRILALESGLNEVLKWGHPCYTLNERNIFLIHGFKHYCALLFHKGALLKDEHGILVQQTTNVQSARQIRFASEKEIIRLATVLQSYIQEAIALEQAGMKVAMKSTDEFEIPLEFSARLKAMPALQKAFNALTPGRQRGYLLYFSKAKQSATREARIEKNVERILAGKGLDDH